MHRIERRLSRSVLAIVVLAQSGSQTPAWVTLADGEKGRLEMEARFMLWGVGAGKDDLPTGTPAPTPQTESIQDFELRRLRLLFKAQASSRLELNLQIGQDNIDAKIARPDAGLRIKDAYLSYERAGALQVVVGQFKVPFLRQNLASAFNQLLVDRAALPALRPAVEGLRDVGGMLWGNHAGLQYRAAVFDGSDQETSNPRSSLRESARLSCNWFTRETALGYTGTTIGAKRIVQVGVQGDRQDHRLDSKDDPGFTTSSRDYRAWAADLFYDQPIGHRSAATLEAAWLDRRDDYDDPALATRATRGYYAQAGWLLPMSVGPGRLQVAGRYESLHTDRGGLTGDILNRTIGVNYYGNGHDRKIQADYTWRREAPTELDNDELRLSVVCVF